MRITTPLGGNMSPTTPEQRFDWYLAQAVLRKGKKRRRRRARKRLKAHDRNQKFNKAYNDELRRRSGGQR